jgi:branched-chain amino acid transport system substrate-binding protein
MELVMRPNLSLRSLAAIAGALLSISTAAAGDLRIGFIGTLSGPLAAMGQDQLDGFLLGLEQRGGRFGGQTIEVVKEDDQLKPDVGVQAVQKLITEDKVPIVTGVTYTNVAMAVIPKLVQAQVFVIATASGPQAFAGANCSPYFFSVSWQNNSMSEALGKYAQVKGYKRIFAMGPNYAGWNDQLTGFHRYYTGEIIKELHTPMNQVDLSAEMAEIELMKPDAVYAHYAGGMAVNFVKQYVQAGLNKKFPLITVASLDGLSLPALKEMALGAISTHMWSPDLQADGNQAFVAAFEKRYGRIPSNHAAQGYDAAALLDSAIAKVDGNVSDKEAFRAAIKQADFKSVRGSFRFNNNGFPIEDFYVLEVAKDAKGRVSLVNKGLILPQHEDPFSNDCPLK